MSKLSLILCTFSATSSVAGLFLTFTICWSYGKYMLFKVDIRYGLYFIIQDLAEHLRSPELSNYVLPKNMEDRSEWYSASACMLCITNSRP